MRDEDVGMLPVSAAGELVGVVTDRDLVCRALADSADAASLRVRDIMTTNPICCAPQDNVEDAVALMEQARVRRLPVMEDDTLVGVIGLGDISHLVGQAAAGEVIRVVSAHHE
jgi:CBS domain-containing protein